MLRKKQIEELKNQLLQKKQKLLEQEILNKNIAEELRAESSSDELDFAEISSDSYNLNLIREKQIIELEEINFALNKIKKGTYDICDMCDEPIGFKRLKIKPEAKFCIECRGIYEKERYS